jgi:hypothetical protein
MKTQLLPAQTDIFSTSLDKGENPRDPPVLSVFYSGGTPE